MISLSLKQLISVLKHSNSSDSYIYTYIYNIYCFEPACACTYIPTHVGVTHAYTQCKSGPSLCQTPGPHSLPNPHMRHVCVRLFFFRYMRLVCVRLFFSRQVLCPYLNPGHGRFILTWGRLPDDMDLYLHAPDGTNKDPNKVSLPTDKTGRCVVMFQVRIYILIFFLLKNNDPKNRTGRRIVTLQARIYILII